jgi:hypothetical protein
MFLGDIPTTREGKKIPFEVFKFARQVQGREFNRPHHIPLARNADFASTAHLAGFM